MINQIFGVIGRKAASITDYNYSKAMVAYAKNWTFEEMNSYLIKPQAYIKGTKMAFAGLRKKDRASVILYMNSKVSLFTILTRHHLILFCACTLLRACCQTTDFSPSIISLVTSSPLPTGKQCIKIVSDFA